MGGALFFVSQFLLNPFALWFLAHTIGRRRNEMGYIGSFFTYCFAVVALHSASHWVAGQPDPEEHVWVPISAFFGGTLLLLMPVAKLGLITAILTAGAFSAFKAGLDHFVFIAFLEPLAEVSPI